MRRPAARSSNMDSTGRIARDEGRVVPAASPAATSAMSIGNWAASLYEQPWGTVVDVC